uniref:RING-type domain-containing protein n=1 Tax=Steinernema glaseri TaxID=37863 RepID=A0A1I7ZNS7_9BILA
MVNANAIFEDVTFGDVERIERILKCTICRRLMDKPLTLLCSHNYCKDCLLAKRKEYVEERVAAGLPAKSSFIPCIECGKLVSYPMRPKVNATLQLMANLCNELLQLKRRERSHRL